MQGSDWHSSTSGVQQEERSQLSTENAGGLGQGLREAEFLPQGRDLSHVICFPEPSGQEHLCSWIPTASGLLLKHMTWGHSFRDTWGHSWQCGAVPGDPSHRVPVSCALIELPTAHLLLPLSSARSQGTGLEPPSRVPPLPCCSLSPARSSISLVENPTVG